MKKIVLLGMAVLLLFGFAGCDFMLQESDKNDGIIESDRGLIIDEFDSKAVIVEGSPYWVALNRMTEPLYTPGFYIFDNNLSYERNKNKASNIASKFFYGIDPAKEPTSMAAIGSSKSYYECKDNKGNDILSSYGNPMAVIADPSGYDNADYVVKSEGQSYGMMIAVQLGWKEEFDRLWEFAFCKMKHLDRTKQESYHYFRWVVEVDKYGKYLGEVDNNTAPDGEEYFAMALLLAHQRWGSGSSTRNYLAQAKVLTHHMASKNRGLSNMFQWRDRSKRLVLFQNHESGRYFTDPSYILPNFYGWFAAYPYNSNERTAYYQIAAYSRNFLKNIAIGKNISRPFPPDFMDFSGNGNQSQREPEKDSSGNILKDPVTGGQIRFDWIDSNHDKFYYDSWRVPMNIGMDAKWADNVGLYGKDGNNRYPWVQKYANTYLDKLRTDNNGNYHVFWDPDTDKPFGNAVKSNNVGPVGCNAVLAQWSNQKGVQELFLKDAWNSEASWSTSNSRYYNNILYTMSMLHLCGYLQVSNKATQFSTLGPDDLIK